MALFTQLAELADRLAATSSRLKKRAAIAEEIRAAHGESDEDAGLFALYLAGQPFPEADPRKLNAGGALLSRIVKEITHATDTTVTAAYRRHGDFGAATHDLYIDANRAPAPALTLRALQEAFAQAAVAKTTAIRQSILTELLQLATPTEAKYLIKLMLGDMRIGVKQSLVEEAIAVAAEAPVADVRHAVMLQADLACATEMAFAKTLHEARMRLFHPLGFMLASPVESPEEAIERFRRIPAEADVSVAPTTDVEPDPPSLSEDAVEVTAGEDVPLEAIHIRAQIEDKYDGMRVQLHCGDPSQEGRVALYSRNREDVTESYPEIAEAFARVAETKLGPLILDGELLAWDVAQSRALPFAVLSPRIGRKRVGNDVRVATPVVYMAFDLLYADGDLQLELPLRKRRNRLEAIAEMLSRVTLSPLELASRADSGLFADHAEERGEVQRLVLSPVSLATSAEDLDRAYSAARERGNEGVMIKAADSAYQPGRRGLAWLKLKRELATLDVVITGAEFGHGKRAAFLSDYTFAIRGPKGELLNVGKAYSGVTDAEIAELTEWLKAHTLEDHGHFRTVEPQIVLEVAFNNIMRSTRHASGFAMRFPRILRIRNDKPVEEIDTLERVEEIYQSQPDKPMESPSPD
jgi:DNA ligase-1